MTENLPAFATPATAGNTYTSRPTQVEAMQYDGTVACASEIIDWVLAEGGTIRWVCNDRNLPLCDGGADTHHLEIVTPEGPMRADKGWWIICGTEDEFYPCKDSVFQRKYVADVG